MNAVARAALLLAVALLTTVGRRALRLRDLRGGPDEHRPDDYSVRQDGSRLEFELAVGVSGDAVMSVRTFHDERGGRSDKAVDLTETPLPLDGGG